MGRRDTGVLFHFSAVRFKPARQNMLRASAMDILHRVAKAVKETEELKNHDPEALARVAIATMFNWLGEPSGEAIEAAVIAIQDDPAKCRRVWAVMLAELRKEAGF